LLSGMSSALGALGAAAATAEAPEGFSGSADATARPKSAVLPRNASTGLTLVGTISAQWVSPQVTITIDRITNTRGSGVSGPLRVELWATSTLPVFGNTITHYTLGSFALDPLSAGFEYDNVNETVAYTAPPDGCYYVTVALEEQISGTFYYVDLATFSSGGVPDGAGYDRFLFGSGTCGGPTGPCVQDSTTACLLNGRFRATVRFRHTFDNSPADSDAFLKPVTGFANPSFETAFFYFNSSNNIEMLLKMLDQGNTDSQGHPTIAVLFGSATPLRLELTITDTINGAVRAYTSPFNSQSGGTDFTAFIK
jgi:hypothetical protein